MLSYSVDTAAGGRIRSREGEAMTDRTRYCELCEAAQREIAELKAGKRLIKLLCPKCGSDAAEMEPLNPDFLLCPCGHSFLGSYEYQVEIRDAEIARLKAARFTMIDEALKEMSEFDRYDPPGFNWVVTMLNTIRAKYAGPICPTCGDKDGPWLPEKNYICEKCDRGE